MFFFQKSNVFFQKSNFTGNTLRIVNDKLHLYKFYSKGISGLGSEKKYHSSGDRQERQDRQDRQDRTSHQRQIYI